jgi:hypothetical protein
MATTKIGHSHRRSDAQPTQDNRDNQSTNQHGTADAAARVRQRRANAERRREKRWERFRARETTITRRVSVHQPGPQQDARDHRGEVA